MLELKMQLPYAPAGTAGSGSGSGSGSAAATGGSRREDLRLSKDPHATPLLSARGLVAGEQGDDLE